MTPRFCFWNSVHVVCLGAFILPSLSAIIYHKCRFLCSNYNIYKLQIGDLFQITNIICSCLARSGIDIIKADFTIKFTGISDICGLRTHTKQKRGLDGPILTSSPWHVSWISTCATDTHTCAKYIDMTWQFLVGKLFYKVLGNILLNKMA